MNKIKEFRTSAGMSIEQLAELTELSIERLTRLENGIENLQDLDVRHGLLISQALDTPLEEII